MPLKRQLSTAAAGMGAAGKKKVRIVEAPDEVKTKVKGKSKVKVVEATDEVKTKVQGKSNVKVVKDDEPNWSEEEDQDDEDDDENDDYINPSSIAFVLPKATEKKDDVCCFEVLFPRVVCCEQHHRGVSVQAVEFGVWDALSDASELPIKLTRGGLYELSVKLNGDSKTPASKSAYYAPGLPMVLGMDSNSIQILTPFAEVSLEWTLKSFVEGAWTFISEGECQLALKKKNKNEKPLAISIDLTYA